jgi:hypothetical protein
MPRIFTLLLALLLAMTTTARAAAPIDHRDVLPASQWTPREGAQWESPVRATPFAFDEMIYSWHTRLAPGEGFRLHLRVTLDDGTTSPWLYAGYWGDVPPEEIGTRRAPRFEHGSLELDQLLLRGRRATAWQFRIDSLGLTPLTNLPRLNVLTTDNAPDPATAARHAPPAPACHPPIYLALPYRAQADSKGNPTPDRCQTAAVATAMQYFGATHALEDLIPWTNDPEYDHPGIWPRTLGAAAQMGFDVRIDRFRDWQSVRAALHQGHVILASIKAAGNGPFVAPPYKTPVGGHIVALIGHTDDGRVLTVDSAFPEEKGRLTQWLAVDFERIWFTRGAVGMVVLPPPGFTPPVLTDIPPFPIAQTLNADRPTPPTTPGG